MTRPATFGVPIGDAFDVLVRRVWVGPYAGRRRPPVPPRSRSEKGTVMTTALTVTITDPDLAAQVVDAASRWNETPDWVVERTLANAVARADCPATAARPRKPRAVVTDEMAATMRRLHDDGVARDEIARQVGVHSTTVWRYVRGGRVDA